MKFKDVKVGDVFQHIIDNNRFVVTEVNQYYMYTVYNCGYTRAWKPDEFEWVNTWERVSRNKKVTVTVS